MDLLLFALVVFIIAALVVYIVRLLPLGSPFSEIAQAIVLLIAVVIIVQHAGFV